MTKRTLKNDGVVIFREYFSLAFQQTATGMQDWNDGIGGTNSACRLLVHRFIRLRRIREGGSLNEGGPRPVKGMSVPLSPQNR